MPPGVTTDLDGNPRIQGVCVDMGAFESEFIVIDFSGWVWMDGSSDFGYSLDELNLVYFFAPWPVWYYNSTTGLWDTDGPVGWIYVDWPFLYDYTDTLGFALPPVEGAWVYHYSTHHWEFLPRIIP